MRRRPPAPARFPQGQDRAYVPARGAHRQERLPPCGDHRARSRSLQATDPARGRGPGADCAGCNRALPERRQVTTELQKINPQPFTNRFSLPARELGKAPVLQWIEIEKLRIDTAYQRTIFERGAKNVRTIAAEFE